MIINCHHKDPHSKGCRDPRSTSFLCKCNLTKIIQLFIKPVFYFLLIFFLLFALFQHNFFGILYAFCR